jgi:two-component system LytT family response regulator
MTKIRTLVADDETIARSRMLALLREEGDIEVVAECASGSQTAYAIRQTAPDLMFLDVQMPDVDGLHVLEAVEEGRRPAVVFVTAYDAYALHAFEVHAVDYLLKPFSAERFRSALGRARLQVAHRRAAAAPRQPAAPASDIQRMSRLRERLIVKSGGRVYFLRVAEIDWCEAEGNYVCLHVGGQTHTIRDTMAHLEAQLGIDQFVRIHRSAIVNVDRIQELQSSFSGEYIVRLRDGTRLTLSRGYRDALQRRLGLTI